MKIDKLTLPTLTCVTSILAAGTALTAAPTAAQSPVPPATRAKAPAPGAIKPNTVGLSYSTHNPFEGEDPATRAGGFRQVKSSYKLANGGAALLKQGDVAGARTAFQQALAMEPNNPDALYGMARCAGASGDSAGEIGYYRRVVYSQARSVLDVNTGGFRETDVPRLMEFALALDRAGQAAEAVAVYDHAADLLNYQDADLTGKPHQEALLPDLGNGPGQTPYTPQLLLAMIHLATGVDAPGYDVGELRQAVSLAPDSAAAYFYLGKCLYARQGMYSSEAKAMLKKAVQLGDDRTAKAAQSYLKYILL